MSYGTAHNYLDACLEYVRSHGYKLVVEDSTLCIHMVGIEKDHDHPLVTSFDITSQNPEMMAMVHGCINILLSDDEVFY